MLNFKLGADPELFMADRFGALKASCGKIGGSKEAPMPMGLGEGFMIQEDNVAVEFNIPPASSAEELRNNMRRALKEIASGVKTMYDYEIVNLSAASFPEEELASPAAQVFGCDPDFDAWTMKKNPRPTAVDKNLRSCGGHIHVGLEDPKIVSPIALVRAMDLFLGVPSVIMDKGELRKRLYGKRGAHRVKPYGVEYRTLSNFWIFDDRLIDWAFNNTKRALAAVVARSVDIDSEEEPIGIAINENSHEMAKYLVNKYNLEVVNV
jgi:hypothetical protein